MLNGHSPQLINMNYQFLPFRFIRQDENVFVSNEAGEYVIMSQSSFNEFIDKKLTKDSPLTRDLFSKQIIFNGEDFPIEMLSVKVRTKKKFLRDFTSLHMVVPTLRCNSNCSYCQVSKKDVEDNSYDMTKATAKKTVDTIFKSPSANIKIEFQGGEPLLNFPIVKYIIEYAEWKNLFIKKNLEFVICTNLTLLTPKILKYLKGHKVYISTSIDGPGFLHNKNRPLSDCPESYEQVVEKIQLCREVLGEDSVSALMTTSSFSLKYSKEIIDTYLDLGMRSIFLRALNPYGFAKRDENVLAYSIEQYIEFYFTGLNYILDLNRKGIFFPEEYATILLTKLLTPFSTGFVDLQSPAGVGIAGALYDYDGNVYASDEGRMLAATGDMTFLMGNVNTESYQSIFNSDYMYDLIGKSTLEVLPECHDCAFIHYCGADPVRNYNQGRDIVGHRPSSDICKKNKAIIGYLLDLLNNDDSVENIFWSWIMRKNMLNDND